MSLCEKNPDLVYFMEIRDMISGRAFAIEVETSADAILFKNAPLVSVDAERVFSRMAEIQAPQWLTIGFTTLRQSLIIFWKTMTTKFLHLNTLFTLHFSRNS